MKLIFTIVALRAALKRLGYLDTYHMMSASVENPPDCAMWYDALTAKYDGKGEFGKKEWDQLLGHCQVSHYFGSISAMAVILNFLGGLRLAGCSVWQGID